MKKVSIFLLTLLALLPWHVKAETEVKEPVKVYMFEAGGCPYCEQEKEYLQGLESYNEKFVIVEKEAFIDHVNFDPGVDYDLAQQVANTFKKAGFKDADGRGTPFVIISDLYAATMYNSDLEKYINQAYEEGDKDVVSCIEEGRDDCIEGAEVKTISGKAIAIIGVSAVVLIGAILVLNRQFSKLEEIKEEKKEAPKKEEASKEEVKKEVKTVKAKEPKVEAKKKTTAPKSKTTQKPKTKK